MHGQNARKRTESSLHNPQIRIHSTLPTSGEGMAALGGEILLSTVTTISCRHWASSTFKFPTYRENSESTNKDSTLNLSSTHRKYRCRLYYRKGRWTGKSSFQYLSNTTHFYRPTPKLNKQPSEMDLIRNHRKKTFVKSTDFNANALAKITNPTFRINAKLLATRQPSL